MHGGMRLMPMKRITSRPAFFHRYILYIVKFVYYLCVWLHFVRVSDSQFTTAISKTAISTC